MGSSLPKGVGRSSSRRRTHSPMSEINVTPFVDVMLVLLIVFMVAAPLLTAGVPIELPQSAAKALPGSEEPITISVRSNGDIYLQETKIAPEALTAKLEAVFKQRRDAQIFIRADRSVDYGHVMTVMGALNGAGFSKIGLVTEGSDGS